MNKEFQYKVPGVTGDYFLSISQNCEIHSLSKIDVDGIEQLIL